MDATFDKYAFPQDGHSSFSSTCIYWKRTDAIAEADSKIDETKAPEREGNSRATDQAENEATAAGA